MVNGHTKVVDVSDTSLNSRLVMYCVLGASVDMTKKKKAYITSKSVQQKCNLFPILQGTQDTGQIWNTTALPASGSVWTS